ncbi:hypothetical protein ACI3O6_10655 [Glaesserella parasuis]|uniref:hypothetical protein n=1 Tax=Glaesserella parasuis TaxID=738 RepID=UPI0013FCB0DA|nr:helix-turn-helix transcriptional regulator [Glaesserella parasuis]MDO9661607.1 helix-turn-helix transcriptional regulator [Glaesserella parasuis]MDO9672696.1 helix-turn-helix transcriptional regulator [Glaesserella parasuis]MDO9690801.1 helix-turn-helix transcriptional regulator [Glaesserella parasuis]MDO9706548.1 helix-turn-helix transcriptional regulator [Glaesserella parasuis]
MSECIISETGIYTNCGRGSSQRDFSKLINISAEAQFKYEKNISLPRIDYLLKIQNIGVDINYILLGYSNPIILTENEISILTAIRTSSAIKNFILGGIKELKSNC